MRALNLVCILTVLTVLSPGALAETFTVPVPFDNIHLAMGVASAGDTILVACGNYTEYDIVMTSGVVMMSETDDPLCATIDAQGQGRHLQGGALAAGTKISGFTFVNGYDTFGSSLHFSGGTVTVANCVFQNNHASVSIGGAIECESDCDLTVSDCAFEYCTASSGGGGIYVYDSTLDLSGCTFEMCESGGDGGAVMLSNFSQADVANCTIWSCSSGLAGDSFCNFGSVTGTIIVDSYAGPAVSCANNSAATLTCCDLYDNAGGDWTGCIASQLGVDGNFSADPLFTAPLGYDFTLSPASPCAPDNNDCGTLIGACGVAYGERPLIASVLDLPDDQGGAVRLRFYRSVYDDPAEGDTPLLSYGVWRLVTDAAALKALAADGATVPTRRPDLAGLDLRAWDDRLFLSRGDRDAPGVFPAGEWEILHSIPAVQRNLYQTVAATLGDSTAAGTPLTSYCISAHTTQPSLWWVSLPDSGYSVDDIAPAAPGGFVLGQDGVLSWDPVPEPDFQYFSVYGSTTDHLDGGETLIGHTIGTSLDVAGETWAYFLLTATDHAGNEGSATVVDSAVGLPPLTGARCVLHPCAPNPFNPRTVIAFDLSRTSRVRLGVYDLAGRLVRTLVDGETRPRGRHEAVWAGDDDAGRAVPAGAYVCRLEAEGSVAVSRMTMLK